MSIKIARTARVRQRFTSNQDYIDEIISWGIDNVYPQLQRSYIDASPISKRCVDTISDFINGDGFVDESKNEIVVARDGYTLINLLNDISVQYSYFKTVCLHIGYNMFGEISEIRPIDPTFARVGDPESSKKGKIAIYSNWAGESWRNYDTEVYYLDEFNPNKSVVLSQIEDAGGFFKYKGQVLFYNFENSIYSASTLDPATEDMAADADISIYRNANLRNGFSSSKLIKYDSIVESDQEQQEIIDSISTQQGAENAGGVTIIFPTEGEVETGKPWEAIDMSLPNIDNLYVNQEKSIRENIAGVANVPKALISQFFADSSIFNQDQLINSWNYFNVQTRKDRKRIESLLNKKILPFFKERIESVTIKEQTIINNDGDVINDGDDGATTNQ